MPLKPVDGLSALLFRRLLCQLSDMMSGVNGQWLLGVSRVSLAWEVKIPPNPFLLAACTPTNKYEAPKMGLLGGCNPCGGEN